MDTVEKFIHRLPEEICDFTAYVRELILAAHPEIEEKLTFGTPFFSCRQWLCYFHIINDKGLEVGFCKGNQLSDKHGALVARNRKVVKSLVYNQPADFNEEVFLATLREAVTLNISKKKKASRKQQS